MSWYNTIVISFSCNEWEEETLKPPKNFKPLKDINRWLKQRKFDPLTDLTARKTLGSNAVLYGVCGNFLDVEEFCEFIQTLKWRSLEDVQLLFWDDNDVKFSVIGFRRAKTKRKR